MASSEMEIASSSTFGCVLRDHNRRVRCRDQNSGVNAKAQSNFQRNLKEFVKDHLHSCISVPHKSSGSISMDENSGHHNNSSFSCWSGNNNSRNSNNNNNHKILRFKTKNREDKEQTSLVSSPRESRVLDRCSGQPASEMITTTEQENHEAELLVLSNSFSVSTRASPSPVPSDSSANMRVSSLVQKWQGYENHHQSKNNRNMESRTSSVASSMQNGSSIEASEEAYERFGLPSAANTESERFGDWKSDRTANIDQGPLSQDGGGQISDGGDRERTRVADIIWKWKSKVSTGKNDPEPPVLAATLAGLRVGEAEQGEGEQRVLYPVVCSPRLRGRHAIADLFMRMARDRHKEIEGLASRQAVSKYPHRSRIQSLLRLRILRQKAIAEDQHRQQYRTCESNRPKHSSTITSLRERFGSASSEQVCATVRCLHGGTLNGNLDTENSSTSNQPSEEINIQEENSLEKLRNTTQLENSVFHEAEDLQEETVPSSGVVWQEAGSKAGNLNSVLRAADLQEETMPSPDAVIWEDTASEAGNLDSQEAAACIETSHNDSEEDVIYEKKEASDQQFIETNLDWINDISRPCSYWKDRRQAWYQEIFDSSSTDEEIRQLIERRSVSAVLASDFRDRMDRLMMSCLQRQIYSGDNEQEGSRSVGASLRRQIQSLGSLEEQQGQEQVQRQRVELGEDEGFSHEELSGEEEEDKEGRSSLQRYHDVCNYFDQTPSSSELPWSHYQDHEVSDDSDHVASTSFQQSSMVHSYDDDTQDGSSLKNVSSIEMELIYDLRAHMEQLHREMSELRKSVKSCMDMQLMFQNSIREEVLAALGRHTDQQQEKEKEESNSKASKRKRSCCCICYEKKVDSLLYRCGHMCTCFDCGHELEWRSGTCPVCGAQIVDVVRASPDDA
ncbi:hypothetical protein Nepgr_022670 [Nepenthes gracilis]|uniref:RING-type domain-containing protein n=1 Tax=Nepenthes gracilis TaxID=150966 RepID=A0AAD3T0R2_NEPGR|nr:hypothetical protein Nepgr_022670 [Nepenthes gracilis]